jgi:hypothetical protein
MSAIQVKIKKLACLSVFVFALTLTGCGGLLWDAESYLDIPVGVDYLHAVGTSSNSIHLTWGLNGFKPGGYHIYRAGNSNGSYTKIGSISEGIDYIDSGLSAGTTYYYKVAAWNSHREGPASYTSATTYP